MSGEGRVVGGGWWVVGGGWWVVRGEERGFRWFPHVVRESSPSALRAGLGRILICGWAAFPTSAGGNGQEVDALSLIHPTPLKPTGCAEETKRVVCGLADALPCYSSSMGQWGQQVTAAESILSANKFTQRDEINTKQRFKLANVF